MRLNKFIASATGLSRRAADAAIADGLVRINDQPPTQGHNVLPTDTVTYRGQRQQLVALETVLLHKPVGYVVSRQGQGDKTIYELLPPDLQHLKSVGRLDKYSSGLLLLTNDGALAQQLTHPKYQKAKVYQVTLAQPLQPLHRQMISDYGVQLDDGPSQLSLEQLAEGDAYRWQILMREGRNRQIRRTFLSLGYGITGLHRTEYGPYRLGDLKTGAHTPLA